MKPKKRRRQSKKRSQQPLTLFEKMLAIFCKPSKVAHLIIASASVGLGFIFNSVEEMPGFVFKAPFGLLLYIIHFCAIKYLVVKNKEIRVEFTGDPKLVKCQTEYTKKFNANLNYILCFIACVYFSSISIILGFVKLNLIGIYSLIGLCVVVFSAFVVFQQYIYILLLLHAISKISPGKFFELLPERTRWLHLLETISNTYRNTFIISGSLFTLLFIVFSPVNSIQIIFQDRFMSPLYVPLLCTWIIILLAIIFMIPFSSLVRHRLLQKTYSNLTAQSIDGYSKLYESSSNANKLIYMDIILRMNDRKYTLQNSYAWVIPVVVSVVNFSSVVISTIVDLKDIGILS